MRYHHLSKVKENATKSRRSVVCRVVERVSIVADGAPLSERCRSARGSPVGIAAAASFAAVLFLFWGITPKGVGLLVPLGCVCCHTCTCGLSTSSSLTALYGDLILRGASCLDAFSTYPDPTRLPGGAPGGTTGSPVVGPTRSSRTSVGSSQISCAHNR